MAQKYTDQSALSVIIYDSKSLLKMGVGAE